MKRFILQRIGYSLISLFLLTLTIFLFVRLTGDPTVLLVEPGASREDMAMVRQQLVHEKAMVLPIWELGFLNGHGARVQESGLGLIPGHAYSAPYEDVKVKK